MLAGGGDTVRILGRSGNDLRHVTGLPCEVISGRLGDSECLERAVRGITHIYHCAGCSTDWAPWPVYYEANVAGVLDFLAAPPAGSRLPPLLHTLTRPECANPLKSCANSPRLLPTQ